MTDPFSSPVGPNGPYLFGAPDVLVGINFPQGKQTGSKPWYWYVKKQLPFYFQYIGTQAGGHGWQCTPNLPVIKILPIDTQPIVPTHEVGFTSVEDAIDNGFPDGTWGRFQFTDDFFWKVLGIKRPEFSSRKGIPTQTTRTKKTPISTTIKNSVKTWEADWNNGAGQFNAATRAVNGDGTYNGGFTNGFAVAWPKGFTLPELQAHAGDFYFGAIPPTAVFDTGQAYFWKQAQAFAFGIGQLDDKVWDMSIFPPRRTTFVTSGFSSAQTKDYSGYGQVSFPLFFNVV